MSPCPICGDAAVVTAKLGALGREWFCPGCGVFQLESEAEELLAQHDLQPHHRYELSGRVAQRQDGAAGAFVAGSFLQGELTRMGVRRLH